MQIARTASCMGRPAIQGMQTAEAAISNITSKNDLHYQGRIISIDLFCSEKHERVVQLSARQVFYPLSRPEDEEASTRHKSVQPLLGLASHMHACTLLLSPGNTLINN
jgi:hypothetical protein